MTVQDIQPFKFNAKLKKPLIIIASLIVLACVIGSILSKEVHVTIDIDAPPAVVWAQLSDFNKYAEWNPYFKSVHGLFHVATHLKIIMKTPRGAHKKIEPVILLAKENQELKWLHRDMLPGISDIEHSFIIQEKPNGNSHVILRARFTGISYFLMWGTTGTDAQAGLTAMNSALKNRAESITP